jgi:transposase
MYYSFWIDLPESNGKFVYEKHGGTTYVKYEVDRVYDSGKKITYPKRVTIGKLSEDRTKICPNEKFLSFFPNNELPISDFRTKRSSCLRAGAFIIIRKIIKEYKLDEILGKYFNERELGLFLDLAAYTIIEEDNAGQYYPDYAYNHPLFTKDMKVYSDSTVSDFLSSVTADQSAGFLNEWNGNRSGREKIYISYDSTNKNSEAGDVEFVEYGKPKVDVGFPVFNYAVGYDVSNREPLFYEKYPGSIVDVSQLRTMLNKAEGYGYKKVGFILDRGYFSKQNIEHMDKCGYSFVIMVKGMADLVSSLILEHKGSFENKRACDMDGFGVYGKTIKRKLYGTDEKERYFHLYHNISQEASQRLLLEDDLEKMKRYMAEHQDEEITFGPKYSKYFCLHYDKTGKTFLMAEEKTAVTEREIDLCGYFVIVTSDKMTAKEALHLYKSRDFSEKAFRGDKSYLGDKSMRTQSTESTSAKIFVEFVALIIRNKIYTSLLDELTRLGRKPNYMTVPAAIRELEKIELTRQTDNIYRLDHAVTATQKKILNAFGMTEKNIEYRADWISGELKKVMIKEGLIKEGGAGDGRR